MYEKTTVVDHIAHRNSLVTVLEDGKPFAEQVKGNYFKPGDDYSAEGDQVKAICALTHTDEVVAAYRAAQEAANLLLAPSNP